MTISNKNDCEYTARMGADRSWSIGNKDEDSLSRNNGTSPLRALFVSSLYRQALYMLKLVSLLFNVINKYFDGLTLF